MANTIEIWNVINKNLDDYCTQRDFLQREINSYVKKLAEIIIEQYNFIEPQSFKMFSSNIEYKKQNLEDTFKIVSKFFKDINEDLYNSFLNIMYNKDMTKISCVENIHEVTQGKLYLGFSQTSSDPYILCHEVVHKIFSPKKEVDEVNSITFEKILNDKYNIDDNKFMMERLSSDLSEAILFLFVEWISKIFLKNNKKVNEKIIKNELEKLDNQLLKFIFEIKINYLLNMIYKNELYRQVAMARYIIGSTFSTTILNKIRKGIWSFENYFKKVNQLNTITTFQDGLNILELNYITNNDILIEIQKNYFSFYQEIYKSRKR